MAPGPSVPSFVVEPVGFQKQIWKNLPPNFPEVTSKLRISPWTLPLHLSRPFFSLLPDFSWQTLGPAWNAGRGFSELLTASCRGRQETKKGPQGQVPFVVVELKKWVLISYQMKYATYSVAQLCPTVCNPMDCSPPASSVYGIFQARILEWVAISSSRGSAWPRDWTSVSYTGRWILYHWATWEAQDPTYLRATKSTHCNYWAQVPQLRPNTVK